MTGANSGPLWAYYWRQMPSLRDVVLVLLVSLPPARGAEEPAGEEKPARAEETTRSGDRQAVPGPWAFSLGLYTWLPAVDAELTSGNLESEIDESLVDIIDATTGVPLSIGGRLEAYWKRLGIFVDANYFNLRFG